MTETEMVRVLGLFLVIVVSIVWIWKYRKVPIKRVDAFFVLSLMLHSFIFYITLCFFKGLLTPTQINIWSHAIRVQTYITLILIGVT